MTVQVDYKAFGKRVCFYRHFSGATQAKLAEAIGVTEQFIGAIERGVSIPSLQTLISLSYALNVSPNDLLADSLPENGFDGKVYKFYSACSIYGNTISDWLGLTEQFPDYDPMRQPATLEQLQSIPFCAIDEELPFEA